MNNNLRGHLIKGTNPPFLVDLFRNIPKRKNLKRGPPATPYPLPQGALQGGPHMGSPPPGGPPYEGPSTGEAPPGGPPTGGPLPLQQGPEPEGPQDGGMSGGPPQQKGRNLIEKILGVPPYLIFRLPIGQPINIKGVYVTLIDANHCPGAVMFLFEGPGVGRSLHCGDFRYCPTMLQTLNPKPSPSSDPQTLNPNSPPQQQQQIDKIYLDTTYAEVKTSFPPQQDVLSAALQIATQEAGGSTNVRFLVGTYTIGKERIALHVARGCQLKIFVAPERRRAFRCLEFSPEDAALFTENPQDAQVDLVPMNVCGSTFPPRGNFRGIRQYLHTIGVSAATRVVAFVGTGWAAGAKKPFLKEEKISIYFLPYSEHSSCAELEEFVKALNPKEVIPTVTGNEEEDYNRLYYYFNNLECLRGLNMTKEKKEKFNFTAAAAAAAAGAAGAGAAGAAAATAAAGGGGGAAAATASSSFYHSKQKREGHNNSINQHQQQQQQQQQQQTAAAAAKKRPSLTQTTLTNFFSLSSKIQKKEEELILLSD
ncbi:DNA cross-link repair protein, putative [Eimeria maxima]|uniref:DNA cross-link repair protein, putative n=1 Tax=Eimeria maxima TaxID=5804 RepID=U6MCL9_EIMMA|nr:DNA cross-link repair protein, putative [Eimeria maxima]CDJ61766.1 DNA cross-link repair protein, putative [Eimeria maxima]